MRTSVYRTNAVIRNRSGALWKKTTCLFTRKWMFIEQSHSLRFLLALGVPVSARSLGDLQRITTSSCGRSAVLRWLLPLTLELWRTDKIVRSVKKIQWRLTSRERVVFELIYGNLKEEKRRSDGPRSKRVEVLNGSPFRMVYSLDVVIHKI